RRVLLARSLVMRPQAVILDEPTAGLDILARASFLCELNSLANSGVQIILVTHHLEEILPCIDRTILLKTGKVFLDCPTNIAICEESVSSLFGTRIRVDRDGSGFYHSRLA
ncbi:MAG TPA: AAA family ATPase, partial [Pirellula sp.]|nr:AAA family ATPase [Pirellula sp.]